MFAVVYVGVVVGFFQGEEWARLAVAKHLDGSAVRKEWREVERTHGRPDVYTVRLSSQQEFERVLGN